MRTWPKWPEYEAPKADDDDEYVDTYATEDEQKRA